MLVAGAFSPLVEVSVLTGMVRQYGFPTLLQRGTQGSANRTVRYPAPRLTGVSKHLQYWDHADATAVFRRRPANQGVRKSPRICSVHSVFSGRGDQRGNDLGLDRGEFRAGLRIISAAQLANAFGHTIEAGDVDAGRHLRDSEILERPRPRRDISFAVVAALIVMVVVLGVLEAFAAPGHPESWIWAGWWMWIGVNAVCSIDDWWQGWHVPERGVR